MHLDKRNTWPGVMQTLRGVEYGTYCGKKLFSGKLYVNVLAALWMNQQFEDYNEIKDKTILNRT